MASQTVYSCDVTGNEDLTSAEIVTLPVALPDPEHGLTECGSIDITSELIPDDFPTTVTSDNQKRLTTTVICEGDRGMGGKTLYARLIGLAIPGEHHKHNKTFGRDRVIDTYGQEVVDVLEQAVQNRHVVAQRKSEYPNAGLSDQ